MLFHTEDAAAVLKGSGTSISLQIFCCVNFSSAIAKEQQLELATSVFLLDPWVVEARFGHSNMNLSTTGLLEDR
jgi:hypothetical protein